MGCGETAMNKAVVALGLLIAIGGAGAFLYGDMMASQMTLFEIYAHPRLYDTYQTILEVGLIFGVIGVILFVVGFALQDQKEGQTVVIRQVGQRPALQGQPMFCPYCRNPTEGKPFCAYCGKKT
jgi:hydrogenase/urease accessory protein HupE